MASLPSAVEGERQQPSAHVSAPTAETRREDVQRSNDRFEKRELTIIDGRVTVSVEYYNEMRNRSLEMRDKFAAGQAMKSLIQQYGHFYSVGERKKLCRVIWHIVHSTGIEFVRRDEQC